MRDELGWYPNKSENYGKIRHRVTSITQLQPIPSTTPPFLIHKYQTPQSSRNLPLLHNSPQCRFDKFGSVRLVRHVVRFGSQVDRPLPLQVSSEHICSLFQEELGGVEVAHSAAVQRRLALFIAFVSLAVESLRRECPLGRSPCVRGHSTGPDFVGEGRFGPHMADVEFRALDVYLPFCRIFEVYAIRTRVANSSALEHCHDEH